jgi:integrase/recombinase XerD
MRVRGYSPATIESYQSSLRLFSQYLLQEKVASFLEVSSATLRNYQLWLQKKSYTGWTVLARLQAVRRLFQHLERTQVILLNPCAVLEPPKLSYRLPKAVLTLEEARCLLETPDISTCVGLRNRAILEVFYGTGIRRSAKSSPHTSGGTPAPPTWFKITPTCAMSRTCSAIVHSPLPSVTCG